MTVPALVFMMVSWGVVLGLTSWCFLRVVRASRATEGKGAPVDEPPPESEVG